MRIFTCLATALVLLILVQSVSRPAIGQTPQTLVGKWKVVKSQGEEGSDPGTMEFFKDGRIIIMQKNYPPAEGTYTTDDTKSPATIVIKVAIEEPETHKKNVVDCYGIYKFNGDRLILKAVNGPKTNAPTDFTVDKDGYTNLEMMRDQ